MKSAMRPPPPRPRSSWSSAAIGSPSGSARQKLSPYSRIVSAISCPTVRSPGGSGGGSSGIEGLEQPGDRIAQQREPVVEAPERAIRLGDLVHDGAHLERRHA